jgi:hypothetical protein
MAWQSEVEVERKRQAEEAHKVEMVRQLSGARRRRRQELTLVHFSAQPEPFLTQNTPETPPDTS